MEPWYTPKFVSNQIGSHRLKMVKDSLPKNINQSTKMFDFHPILVCPIFYLYIYM